MTIFETSRLILRQLTLEDLDAVAMLYADPVVMATKGGVRPYGYAKNVVEEAIEAYSTDGYDFWAMIHRADIIFIGLCGLLKQDVDGQREVEIAYTVAKEYWGRGLATEAAQAVKKYGFNHFGFKRFVSLIAHDNIASQRVALKNGMIHEKDCIDHKGRAKRVYAIQIS